MVDNMDENAIFVKLNEYKDALGQFDLLKQKVSEAKVVLAKVEELKKEEKAEIELWQNSVKEIERKIRYIDGLIVGGN